VALPIYSLHHHPKLWDHPDEFLPERWLSGVEIPHEQFLPFSFGPRNCIGMVHTQR